MYIQTGIGNAFILKFELVVNDPCHHAATLLLALILCFTVWW